MKDCTKEVRELREIRDELLEAVITLTNVTRQQHSYNHYFKIMKRADAIKEKEQIC